MNFKDFYQNKITIRVRSKIVNTSKKRKNQNWKRESEEMNKYNIGLHTNGKSKRPTTDTISGRLI